MNLPKDVQYLIVRNLPIEKRMELRVKPGRVQATPLVKETVSLMAKVANHPNHVRLTRVRTGETTVETLIVYSEKKYLSYIESQDPFVIRRYEPNITFIHYHATSLDYKKFWYLEHDDNFRPFCTAKHFNHDMFTDSIEMIREYLSFGGPY